MTRIQFLSLPLVVLSANALAQSVGPTAGMLTRQQFIRDMDVEFSKMDADKNGQLTAAEVAAFNRIVAVATAEARNRAQFIQLDIDKNGQISPNEFRMLLQPVQTGNGQSFVAGRDLNKDRQVSLIEHRTATLANFDRLDADKDGVVTATEMRTGGFAAQ